MPKPVPVNLPVPGTFFTPRYLGCTGISMTIDWYKEFVNLDYEPAKDDLICLYYFEPAAGIRSREAVGRIASESSTGTWTTLYHPSTPYERSQGYRI